MKIAITSTEKTLNSQLDPRFGRCQYFIIYNLETNDFECIDNINKDAVGGAGTAAAQLISSYNVSAVISGNFGPNAVMGLQQLGIKMYSSNTNSIQSIIDDYRKENLKEISDATVPGKHR